MFLKKLFFGVLAAFMVASCSNDDFADKEAANVQSEKCILRVKVKPFLVNYDDTETRAWVGISKTNKKFFSILILVTSLVFVHWMVHLMLLIPVWVQWNVMRMIMNTL